LTPQKLRKSLTSQEKCVFLQIGYGSKYMNLLEGTEGTQQLIHKPIQIRGGDHMKRHVYLIAVAFVLFTGANAAHAQGLNGQWKLQVNVTTPFTCQYEDGNLVISQTGTYAMGASTLTRVGVGSCPLTLQGTIQGDMGTDPTNGSPFCFSWFFPEGPQYMCGQFTNPQNAGGTFSGFYLSQPANGTWSLTWIGGGGTSAVPASTPWGLITLTVLAGLGAVYYLRKRMTAVS
jgi:hypothetical protein